MSFVSWSSTRIFHTGGPLGGGTLSPDEAFPEADTVEAEGSTGVLRLSMERSAFVWACCTVTGEVACEKKTCYYLLEGYKTGRRTCLSAWLAIVDGGDAFSDSIWANRTSEMRGKRHARLSWRHQLSNPGNINRYKINIKCPPLDVAHSSPSTISQANRHHDYPSTRSSFS